MMRIMNSNWKQLLIALLLLTAPLLHARTTVNRWVPGQTHLAVSVSYMQAGHCDYHFATNRHSGGTFIETADPGFDPGLQIALNFARRCFFASISYLSWGSTNFAFASRDPTALAPGDFAMVGLPAIPDNPAPGWISANARLRYTLRHFDLRAGKLVHDQPGSSLGLFANLRYLMRLEQKQRLTAQARVLDMGNPVTAQACFEQNASYCGVGLGGGAVGEVHLWRCFSVGGEFNATIIPGTRKLIRHRATFDPGFTNTNTMVNFRDFNSVIPVVEFQAHIIWPWKILCAKGTCEVGYQLHQYWQALSFTKQVNTARVCTNFGVLGPYFTAQLAF